MKLLNARNRLPEDERRRVSDEELRIAELIGDDEEFLERVCHKASDESSSNQLEEDTTC